jgi:hypothetical protein
MEIRTVKPKEIIVKDRSRKDLGDIERLATSIEQIGLLHPPVVTSDLLLIAGERRLEAIKILKWSDLPVHVVSTLAEAAQLLQAERDENTCRKDLAPSEAVALGVKLETIEAPKAQDRREATQGRPPKTGGNLPPVTEAQPKTRDVVGAAVGVSGKTYEKAKAVVCVGAKKPEAGLCAGRIVLHQLRPVGA